MTRWRCARRACRASGWMRKTTRGKVAPDCPRCGHVMHKDKYRSSKRERRSTNCWCSDVPWSAKGGPHMRTYCEKLRQQQYEDSTHECSQVLQPEVTAPDLGSTGASLADVPF